MNLLFDYINSIEYSILNKTSTISSLKKLDYSSFSMRIKQIQEDCLNKVNTLSKEKDSNNYGMNPLRSFTPRLTDKPFYHQGIKYIFLNYLYFIFYTKIFQKEIKD